MWCLPSGRRGKADKGLKVHRYSGEKIDIPLSYILPAVGIVAL